MSSITTACKAYQSDSYVLEKFKQRNDEMASEFLTYEETHYKPHVTNTREMMKHGAKGLSGRVAILGPGLIEPLIQLLDIFTEVVLVGYDEETLKKLSAANPTKIKYVKVDLSHGLIEKVKTILARTKDSKYSSMQFIEDISREMHPTNALDLPNLLGGKFDYVISSLVCTQLSEEPFEILTDVAKAHFGVSDLSLQPTFNSRFWDANKLVADMHVKDLHALVKPTGMIYFSDTIFRTYFLSIVGNCSSITISKLDLKQLDEFRATQNIKKEKEWTWLENPKTGKGFHISAFLVQSKMHPMAQPAASSQAEKKDSKESHAVAMQSKTPSAATAARTVAATTYGLTIDFVKDQFRQYAKDCERGHVIRRVLEDNATTYSNIRNFMLETAKGTSGRAIVLGASKLEPLLKMSSQFQVVDLVDYIEEPMIALTAELPSNVKRTTCDLTNGFCESIEALLPKVMDTNLEFHQCFAELQKHILKILTTFGTAESGVVKKLGKASFVISSSVSTQLGGFGFLIFERIFEKRYGFDPNSLDGYHKLKSELIALFIRCHLQELVEISTGPFFYGDKFDDPFDSSELGRDIEAVAAEKHKWKYNTNPNESMTYLAYKIDPATFKKKWKSTGTINLVSD